MTFHYHTCDVFTSTPFGGNQLAVFPDARGIPEERLQQIAREFNFSETTFVYPPDDPRHTFRVRIFTPGNELPFAGHPTIGTAVTLATLGRIPLKEGTASVIFEEKVGPVPVTVRADNGRPEYAQLTAAQLPVFNDSVPAVEEIAEMLTLPVTALNSARYPLRYVSVGFPFLFVAVKDREALGRIRVNVPVMERLGLKEVFVFTDETGGQEVQFRARMFAPLLGIAEDPATGSAAAAFGGYLAAMEDLHEGTLRWSVDQGVEMGRPSRMFIETDMNAGAIAAVRVGGYAVMMMEGDLTI